MNELTFAFARPDEEKWIRELLVAEGLPDEDVSAHLRHFLVVRKEDAAVGCVGLELAGECALLRSLVVRPDLRSTKIGEELVRRVEAYAIEKGFDALYLLTTTASGYFERRGYERLDREKAPKGIASTQQFQSLCPSSAVLMKKQLRS